MNVVSLYAATADKEPSRIALRMGQKAITYAQLMERVARVAAGLQELGVRRGERVLIFSENCPEFLVAHLAVARLGAITATANPSFRRRELSYILANAEPRLAFVEDRLRPVLQEVLAASTPEVTVIGLRSEDGPDLVFDGLSSSAAKIESDVETADDEGVLISYTSGTSSRPKPVYHSHSGQAFLAQAHAHTWRLRPSDRVLMTLPLAWLYGLTTVSQACLVAGATVILEPHFNPIRALSDLAEHRITVFIGVTTMFVQLVRVLEQSGQSVELTLRMCVSGGEPRNEAAFARFQQLFRVPVHEVYATSECLPIFAYDPEHDPQPRPGSAGRLVPGVHVRIVDAQGREVRPGEVGELYASSPGQMLSYYREPELSAQVLADGWFRTRDLCKRDQDGYYYVVGRASDLIIRGGSNISPLEVESVLSAHVGVAECAVVGLPDPVQGQRVAAFVVLYPGSLATVDQLRTHCETTLARYKIPTEIHIMQALPRGATGKIQKSVLIEKWAGPTPG
jgi:long-chain acyl-CoA synthetase